MENNLNWSLLIPTFLIIFQTALFLILAVLLLRKSKLLKSPLTEIEISAALTAGVMLFGVALISTSSVEGLYKSFIFQDGSQVYTLTNVFSRFGQFFFITTCAQLIFLFFSWFASGIFLKLGVILEELRTGNISVSILIGFIALATAIGSYLISKNVCDILIPVTLNFR